MVPVLHCKAQRELCNTIKKMLNLTVYNVAIIARELHKWRKQNVAKSYENNIKSQLQTLRNRNNLGK